MLKPTTFLIIQTGFLPIILPIQPGGSIRDGLREPGLQLTTELVPTWVTAQAMTYFQLMGSTGN